MEGRKMSTLLKFNCANGKVYLATSQKALNRFLKYWEEFEKQSLFMYTKKIDYTCIFSGEYIVKTNTINRLSRGVYELKKLASADRI